MKGSRKTRSKGRSLAVASMTALSVGLLGTAVTPAHAADTTTTFAVAAGALSITAPASKNLGSGTAGAPLTAQLGSVAVTDGRGALAGSWTASVSSTDFTTGAASADETIAKAAVDYWSGAATTSGVGTFLPGQLLAANKVTLASVRTAYSASATVGNNSATWNPTIIVNVPAQAVAGTYTATITHSVA